MAEIQDSRQDDAGRRESERQDTGSVAEGAAERTGRIPAPVRHQRILQSFQRDGFVSVTEAAREIGVSPMTIRRDLVVLGRQRRLTRTHGGAVAEDAAFDVVEPLFDKRMGQHAEAKTTIARAAADLVGPRESLGLDVGTSALALARELAGRDDLRIFTNNMRAAMELASAASPTYVLGGQVRMPEFSVVGASAVRHVREHFLDRVFLGVSGLGETGIYDYSPEDTEVKRAFIESAGEVVVLCDASKFGRRALSRIAALEDIDVVITDAAPPAALAEALAAAGVRVVVATADDLS